MRAGLPSGGFRSLVPYAGEHGDARPSLTLTYVDPSGFNLGR